MLLMQCGVAILTLMNERRHGCGHCCLWRPPMRQGEQLGQQGQLEPWRPWLETLCKPLAQVPGPAGVTQPQAYVAMQALPRCVQESPRALTARHLPEHRSRAAGLLRGWVQSWGELHPWLQPAPGRGTSLVSAGLEAAFILSSAEWTRVALQRTRSWQAPSRWQERAQECCCVSWPPGVLTFPGKPSQMWLGSRHQPTHPGSTAEPRALPLGLQAPVKAGGSSLEECPSNRL